MRPSQSKRVPFQVLYRKTAATRLLRRNASSGSTALHRGRRAFFDILFNYFILFFFFSDFIPAECSIDKPGCVALRVVSSDRPDGAGFCRNEKKKKKKKKETKNAAFRALCVHAGYIRCEETGFLFLHTVQHERCVWVIRHALCSSKRGSAVGIHAVVSGHCTYTTSGTDVGRKRITSTVRYGSVRAAVTRLDDPTLPYIPGCAPQFSFCKSREIICACSFPSRTARRKMLSH